jgi:hypothetical protein
MQPLTRYFERAVASLRYVMFKGGGWSIVEGFQSLALGYPVALWMLRFACGPREVESQDIINLVMMLDRGETHTSFVGFQHRVRVRILAGDHKLSKLAAWYVR